MTSTAAAAPGTGTLNPDANDFGNVRVGNTSAPITVTVTHTGGDGDNLNITNISATGGGGQFNVGTGCDGASLPQGGSCSFGVTFQPTGPGPASVDLSLISNGGSNTVTLNGTGVQGQLTMTPTTRDFGDQKVGTVSGTETFAVQNTGSADITGINVQMTGSGSFQKSNDDCSGTLDQNETCHFDVRFAPDALGGVSGTATVSGDPVGNGNVQPASATLSGTGARGVGSFTPLDGLAFVTDKGDPSAEQTLHLNNTGPVPLVVDLVQIVGSEQFERTDQAAGGRCENGVSVPAGGDCTIGLRFVPVGTTGANASVSVSHDGSPAESTSSISGVVRVPGIGLPLDMTFEPLQDGRLGPAHVITMRATDGALRIEGSRLAGTNSRSFIKTVDNCAGARLSPNDSCDIVVRFSPRGHGAKTARLIVRSNAGPGNDLVDAAVSLSGQALIPPRAANLNAAAGCHRIHLTWNKPEAFRYKTARIVRNRFHVPRGPYDGTIVPHGSGVADDSPLTQLATFNYAVYGVYTAWNGPRKIYSPRAIRVVRTGRVCQPLNGGTIRDLTPKVDWTPFGSRSRYAIRVVRDSTTILGRYPKQTSFQFSSSWSWDGQRRSLQRGADYYVYVYAYTKGFPNGRWIGQTHFRIR